MEYGLVAKIDQFSDNKALEIQKVQPSNNSSEVKSKDSLDEIQKQSIEKAKETSDAQDVKNNTPTVSQKYEVVLANTNFGYNNASRDFYVKVTRGNSENQYPTEEMMKIKTFVLSEDAKATATAS